MTMPNHPRIKCRGCQRTIRINPKYFGKRVQCPNKQCNCRFVPGAPGAPNSASSRSATAKSTIDLPSSVVAQAAAPDQVVTRGLTPPITLQINRPHLADVGYAELVSAFSPYLAQFGQDRLPLAKNGHALHLASTETRITAGIGAFILWVIGSNLLNLVLGLGGAIGAAISGGIAGMFVLFPMYKRLSGEKLEPAVLFFNRGTFCLLTMRRVTRLVPHFLGLKKPEYSYEAYRQTVFPYSAAKRFLTGTICVARRSEFHAPGNAAFGLLQRNEFRSASEEPYRWLASQPLLGTCAALDPFELEQLLSDLLTT